MTNNINNKVSIKVIKWVVGIIFIAGAVFATVRFTVMRLNVIEPMVFEHKAKIGVIETNIEYIKKGIDQIQESLR